MNFLYYYNWLRFSILTPSYFAKNRLWIERANHNKLIYSFFGFTCKSFIWSPVTSIVINNYIWKNIYFCIMLVSFLVCLLVLFNFNFFVFNFPVKYWLIYFSWRLYDSCYFFFLQIQYLLIISLISSGWYVLNTYFNIQLNLLYLIIFNYFNINTDIKITKINNKNNNYNFLYLQTFRTLFLHKIEINSNLFIVNYYFYLLKFYLVRNLYFNFRFTNLLYNSYWFNFKYLLPKKDNFWINFNQLFYISNIVKYSWFMSLNINNIYVSNQLDLNYSYFIFNWFKLLKFLRWNSVVSYSTISENLNIQTFVNNINLFAKNNLIIYNNQWFSSLEWILYRWLLLSNIYNISINYTKCLNKSEIRYTFLINLYRFFFLNSFYYKYIFIDLSLTEGIDKTNYLNYLNFDISNFKNFKILFTYDIFIKYYLLLFNNNLYYFYFNKYLLNIENTCITGSIYKNLIFYYI